MQPTDPSKFTDQAWDAIVASQDVARRYRNQNLEVEHVMLALLETVEPSHQILQKAGIDPAALGREARYLRQATSSPRWSRTTLSRPSPRCDVR